SPPKRREIGVPDRHDLQRKVERARLDPPARPPDPLRPLVLDALPLLTRVQLELRFRLALQPPPNSLPVGPNRSEHPQPRLRGCGLCGERRARKVLAGCSKRLAALPR